MIEPAATGFFLGLSLIVAIGAQNAFVLRQGLMRAHVGAVALFCALSDAVLIAAGVAGLGTVVAAHRPLMIVVAVAGAGFLIWYGFQAFRRAAAPTALDAGGGTVMGLRAALLAAAAFTWGNPHVYLDTVVLVGSLAAPFSNAGRLAYGIGAATASFAWFFTLAYGARLLAPFFKRPATWRVLDIGIGLIMWAIAGKLIVTFLL
ncbi:MAG: LysE/ArgO family amino acid transporter [Inquilinaceae bacterium]